MPNNKEINNVEIFMMLCFNLLIIYVILVLRYIVYLFPNNFHLRSGITEGKLRLMVLLLFYS